MPVNVSDGDSSGSQDVSVLNYPLDYPDAQAHTDAQAVLAALAEIDAISAALTNGNQRTAITNSLITVTGGVTVNNPISSITVSNFPTTYPDSAAQASLLGISAALTSGAQKTLIVGGLAAANALTVDSNGLARIGINPVNNELPQIGTAASTNADVIPSTDVSGYSQIIVQIKGTWSGQLTVQFSNDNATFMGSFRYDPSGATQPGNTITTNGLYVIPVQGKYFRLRMTTYSSGSGVTGSVAELRTDNDRLNIALQGGSSWAVTQSGTWTVAQGTANAAPWLVQSSYSYSHLAANGSATIKSGAGVLHAVSINTLGIADTITLYDNTAGSGTVIAVINAALSQQSLKYDIAFTTGLTAVIAGSTAPDITISYR